MADSLHWSDGLNDAQRAAVEYDAGPVAVLAGPGTGKTRVITHRIARLIEHDGVSPETVCALTFTTKAATEMSERLGQLIGENIASRVQAGTFHSLGRRLLLRFGDVIGLPASHDLMDTVQQKRMLLESVSEAADAGKIGVSLLADGGRDGVSTRALGWIEHLRSRALFPDDALKLADNWLSLVQAGGPEGENWDEDKLDAERERVRDFACAAEVYGRYQDKALDRALLSFDDYILLPIRILRHSERIRRFMHDELRHLVVDEFQDVNGAQLAFLRELSPPSGSRDICVVGDDDQAIYGFRGSDDRAFQHFKEIWGNAQTVPLDENYRSSKAVLETVRRVISYAHDRFAADKVINAKRVFDVVVPNRVEAVEYEKKSDEAVTIAAMILADRATNPERELSSYAVIGRSHSTITEIGRVLELEGISVDFSQTKRFEEDEAVQDVKAWIEMVVGKGTIAMTRLLTRPPISMETDAAISMQQSYESHLRQARVENEEPLSIADWIAERTDGNSSIALFSELLTTLRGLSVAMTAEAMVQEIIERTGVAHRGLPGGRAEAKRVSALVGFLQFVRNLQSRIDPPGDLAAFQSYYDELSRKEQAEGLAGLAQIDGDEDAEFAGEGVRLLTAHGSKGLEYDTVFVPNIGTMPGCFGRVQTSDKPELPAALSEYKVDPRSAKEREQDEVRRLFYVACTRAQRRLVLLSKRAKGVSQSMHLFQELAWRGKAPMGPDDSDGPVMLTPGEDVMRACIDSGATIRGGDVLATESASLEARSRVFSSAVRTARRAAAEALDHAECGLDGESDFDSVADALIQSARRLAVTAALAGDTGVDMPVWLAGDGVFAKELTERIESSREDRAAGSKTMPMRGPLELSYSKLDSYLRCPACFYLRYVLGLSESSSGQQLVGDVAHKALERFYRQWSEADIEGQALPEKDELLRIAQEIFVAESRRLGGVDTSEFDQIRAQLDAGYDRLHNDRAEVMMLEEPAPFAYSCEDTGESAHTIKAKIDRVDRLADGGFRIIDYKTGKAWDKLTKPKKQDLQLGIYAMALANRLEMPVEELTGFAEYWLFATGQRGVVSLAEMDHTKIRGTIDKAIDGMLTGQFEPKGNCTGSCSIFLGGKA